MKKFFVFFLVFSLLLSLAACGNSDAAVDDTSISDEAIQPESTADNPDSVSEQTDEETEAEAETNSDAEENQAAAALAGVSLMEEGVAYDYHSITQGDVTLPTVGSIMVRNYQVVDSTDEFLARDGWKWHIAESVYTFSDEAARNYGYIFAQCTGDYVKGFTPEGNIPSIEINGEIFEAVDESYLVNQMWNENEVAEVVIKIAVQLPEGYTDGVVCFYNYAEGAQGIVWTETEDFLKDDSLFFRLNKE